LRAEHGDDVAGRFIALEQPWLHDEVMRLVAFSPRLAGPAAELLGEPAIRIYHDNALSKEPGCGRTPWHHDAEHFPLATLQAVTAWIPVTAIPAYMGPLALARGAHVRDMVADLSFDKVGTTYDAAVARRLVESDVAVDASPFAVGEVSFHSALCFHTAGPNRSTQPRRALSTTYYADGARVLESPTPVSGRWRDFVPGVEPGGVWPYRRSIRSLQVARASVWSRAFRWDCSAWSRPSHRFVSGARIIAASVAGLPVRASSRHRPIRISAPPRGHTGMHARLSGACQAGTRGRRGPSVAVRGTADGAHRPSWRPDAVRYMSVDTATRRSTAQQGDTCRDREETAR
jgi:hypothetical protein